MARTPKPLPLAPNKDALKIWTAAPTAQSVVMIYSSQILLFGAEFTQVYATHAGRGVKLVLVGSANVLFWCASRFHQFDARSRQN